MPTFEVRLTKSTDEIYLVEAYDEDDARDQVLHDFGENSDNIFYDVVDCNVVYVREN